MSSVSITVERMAPQPVVCLHRGSSFVSWLIKKQQRSLYSHVSIYFPPAYPGDPDEAHYESREFKGVLRHKQFTLTNKSEQVDQFVFARPLTQEQIAKGRAFLEAQVGKPYDYWMVVGFVSRSDHEGPSSEGRYFCSELVAHWSQEMGELLLLRIDPWAFSPMHVAYSPLLKNKE